MENFNFRRDLKYVDWKATLQVNVMRAAAAGFVAGTLVALMAAGEGVGPWVMAMPLFYAVMLPIGLPIYFGVALVCGFLSERGVPFVGIFAGFMALLFALGDPPLFLLHRARPDLVPLDQPPFLSLRVVIFVLDSTKGMHLPTPATRGAHQPASINASPSPMEEEEPETKAIAAPTDPPRCPGCGAANKASAKFCRDCGLALGTGSADRQPADPVDDGQPPTTAPPSSFRKMWVVVSLVSLALVVVLAVAWLRPGSGANVAGDPPQSPSAQTQAAAMPAEPAASGPMAPPTPPEPPPAAPTTAVPTTPPAQEDALTPAAPVPAPTRPMSAAPTPEPRPVAPTPAASNAPAPRLAPTESAPPPSPPPTAATVGPTTPAPPAPELAAPAASAPISLSAAGPQIEPATQSSRSASSSEPTVYGGPLAGTLSYAGPPVVQNGEIVFRNLPPLRLSLTYDQEVWEARLSPGEGNTQRLILRNKKPGTQKKCLVTWRANQ